METVIDGIGAPVGATPERVGLSVVEAAESIGISKRLLRAVIANGDLPVKKIGRRVIVSPRVLEEWTDAGGAVAGQRRTR